METFWDWPGSRWWRVDLHAHSPVSFDFEGSLDQDDQVWLRWITAARDAGIHAIAITDHNTAEAINHLQNTVRGNKDAPTLFPGVELTAVDGTHLLALLDPGRTQEHVDDLLSTVEIPVDQRGQRGAYSALSVVQILERCSDRALVVGAHVNGKHGLLSMDGQQRLSVLRHPCLVAAEVDPDQHLDEHWIDGSRPEVGRRISPVWFSDGHSFDTLGQRFTWAKMTRPDLEGLRLALLDGSASLKPATQADAEDPNTHADLAIESITVHKGKFMGRPSPMTVRFNPWLNTIIGGRGTGKSTLVDFCRQTLRRESELDGRESDEEGSLRNLYDRRMRVPAVRGSEGLLTPQTRIELVYRKSGDRFVLSWSQQGDAQSIAVLEGETRISQEGNIRERFPVRIYSQKQLFALAQEPNSLLDVIDDSGTVRKAELERSLKQLEARYLSLSAQSRSASRQADDLPDRRASLADVQRKLDILQESGHAQVLSAYRIRHQQDETWQEILRQASQVVASVGRSTEELSVADLSVPPDSEDNQPHSSLRRAHAALKQAVSDLKHGIHQRVEVAQRSIESVRKGPDASLWREALSASESQYREAVAELAEQGISNPNEYSDLLQQATTLRREIETLENERALAERLEDEAETVLDAYRRTRENLSDRRKAFVGEVSSETIQVRLGLLANCNDLTDELGKTLGIDRFEADREAIAQRIAPAQDRPWDWARIDQEVKRIRQFLTGELVSWDTQDGRFNTALKRVQPEQIDRLALYVPEDAVTVRFRDHEGQDWRFLAQGSPGQQTAALLAFVLGYGTEPIILDQPEDDLDNTLIYELLVKRLRETKLNRQVIVVTHNPNIVVHGDAELVLSLEAAAGQSHIACRGGLQERSVRDEICRVMEGGREAFESRYQRIMSTTEFG